MTVAGVCEVASNLVTITDPFGPSDMFVHKSTGTSYEALADLNNEQTLLGLEFIFSTGGLNPLSEEDSGTYLVNTYSIDNNAPYKIDENTFSAIFTPVRGHIGMTIHNLSSYYTYNAPTSYTF